MHLGVLITWRHLALSSCSWSSSDLRPLFGAHISWWFALSIQMAVSTGSEGDNKRLCQPVSVSVLLGSSWPKARWSPKVRLSSCSRGRSCWPWVKRWTHTHTASQSRDVTRARIWVHQPRKRLLWVLNITAHFLPDEDTRRRSPSVSCSGQIWSRADCQIPTRTITHRATGSWGSLPRFWAVKKKKRMITWNGLYDF